jgi:hypothetical protein
MATIGARMLSQNHKRTRHKPAFSPLEHTGIASRGIGKNAHCGNYDHELAHLYSPTSLFPSFTARRK